MRICCIIRWLAMIGMLGIAAAPGWSAPPPEGPIFEEAEVKAAFIYNFAKFVEWPKNSFQSQDAPLRIGVLGPHPVKSHLQESLRGKTVNNREVKFEDSDVIQDLLHCHILFVGESERRKLPEILRRLDGQPILTVSDMTHFTKVGGMIEFIRKDGKLRFAINFEAAQQASLSISSKLLKLAENYRDRSGQ